MSRFSDTIGRFKASERESLDLTAKWVRSFCGTREATERFVAGIDSAIEMVEEEESMTIQTLDETDRKVAYLVGMATAYRKLKRAALRALEPDAVQPTDAGNGPESAGGSAE